tara:strand:- start:561 stop:944 length:384 start_codon:yes stop_codon:yes gene_type:complete
MENLTIEPSVKTPKVDFQTATGILEVEGRSIPENSTEFYRQIFDWLDAYVESPSGNTVFNFKLEYFNTSSSKCILDVLRKLEKIHKNGKSVVVKWFYEEDDEDMMEAGENYQRIVSVPIELELLEED